jgi:pimeloyl-ACP methyl ester carboxylesterase
VVREGYAVAIDGSPIYYRVLGREDGPTLALCDGIGCDGYVWKYLIPELASEYRLVHWHYRGHGRTPTPRDRRRLGIPDLADDLASVLDATDTPRATLMGHSMGVQVCLEGFRRHHERVNGLVLMCGSYGHPLRTFKGQKTMEGLLPWVSFSVGLAPKLTSALLRYTVPTKVAYALAARMEINGDLVKLEDFMPYLEHIGNLDPTLFLGMLAQAGRHSAREILPTVDVPALIVAGTRDGFTPGRLSEEMHDLMPGSELLMISEGSHTAPIERPDLVCRTVHRFLDERIASQAHEGVPATPSRAAR